MFHTSIGLGGPLLTNQIINICMLATDLETEYLVHKIPFDKAQNLYWAINSLIPAVKEWKTLEFWHYNFAEDRFNELETYLVEEEIYFKTNSRGQDNRIERSRVYPPSAEAEHHCSVYDVPEVIVIYHPTQKYMSKMYSDGLRDFVV